MERDELRAVHRLERRFGLAGARVRMLAEQLLRGTCGSPGTAATPSAASTACRCCCFRIATSSSGIVGFIATSATRSMSRGANSDRPRTDTDVIVLRRGRRQRSAHAEDVAPDLPAALRLRPFLDQSPPSATRGRSDPPDRSSSPDRHGQRDRDLRHRRLPRDDDAQPVGQRPLDARRELERPLGPDGQAAPAPTPCASARRREHDRRPERTQRVCALISSPPSGRDR